MVEIKIPFVLGLNEGCKLNEQVIYCVDFKWEEEDWCDGFHVRRIDEFGLIDSKRSYGLGIDDLGKNCKDCKNVECTKRIKLIQRDY